MKILLKPNLSSTAKITAVPYITVIQSSFKARKTLAVASLFGPNKKKYYFNLKNFTISNQNIVINQ